MIRTTVAITKDTARRLSEVSRKYNIVVSALADEVLNVACDAMEMGLTPRDLKDIIVALKLASFVDPVLLPIEVVEKLVTIASRDKAFFESLLEDFKSIGARVASIVVSYYGAPSSLEELITIISIASKISAFKEIKAVRKGDELLEISIIGSWKTMETTKLIEAFIRKALETLGYEIKGVYIGVGSLKLVVSRGR